MNEIEYDASGGTGSTSSRFDLPHLDALVGYVRLRTGDGDVAAHQGAEGVRADGAAEASGRRVTSTAATARSWWPGRRSGPGRQGCTIVRVTSGVGVGPTTPPSVTVGTACT